MGVHVGAARGVELLLDQLLEIDGGKLKDLDRLDDLRSQLELQIQFLIELQFESHEANRSRASFKLAYVALPSIVGCAPRSLYRRVGATPGTSDTSDGEIERKTFEVLNAAGVTSRFDPGVSDQRNRTFRVEAEDLKRAVQTLHDTWFGA